MRREQLLDGKVHITVFALFTLLLADFRQVTSSLGWNVEIKVVSKELRQEGCCLKSSDVVAETLL